MNKVTATRMFTTLATSLVLAASALASGCGDDPASKPSYVEVRLEANAPNQIQCHEAVAIRFEPVVVNPQPAGSLYQTATYTDQPMIDGKPVMDGPNNWECWFTYRSRDLAPGTWRIVGEFSDGSMNCVREVTPGGENRVRIDQEDGCVEFNEAGAAE
jgi:hypothetical protein